MDSLKLAISGMFSIITSFFAYHAAIKKHTVTTKDSDKSIFVSAITNERAKWRSELRTYVAEFCELSIRFAVKAEIDIGLLQNKKSNILLRLNPKCLDDDGQDKHKFDREIYDYISKIFEEIKSGKNEEIFLLVENLEKSAQELLKQEWKKSKQEAISGELEKSA